MGSKARIIKSQIAALCQCCSRQSDPDASLARARESSSWKAIGCCFESISGETLCTQPELKKKKKKKLISTEG